MSVYKDTGSIIHDSIFLTYCLRFTTRPIQLVPATPAARGRPVSWSCTRPTRPWGWPRLEQREPRVDRPHRMCLAVCGAAVNDAPAA